MHKNKNNLHYLNSHQRSIHRYLTSNKVKKSKSFKIFKNFRVLDSSLTSDDRDMYAYSAYISYVDT